MSTIFGDVKKYIGLASDNIAFDDELLMHINAAFSKMTRAGVGSETGLMVDSTTTWESLSTDTKVIQAAKQYVTISVKLSFDSSTMSSFVLKSYQDIAEEALWTLNNYCDYWNESE